MGYQTGVQHRRIAAPFVDHIQAFIAHQCQCAAHFGIEHKVLRAAYLTWCADYDLKPVSERAFCEALAKRGYVEGIGMTGRRWNGLRLI